MSGDVRIIHLKNKCLDQVLFRLSGLIASVMKHQEQRGEETVIKPKHIVKYKNVLIFKSTPLSVSSSACRNHGHAERSPFFLQFVAESSTDFTEAVKNVLGGCICQHQDKRRATALRDLWEIDSDGEKAGTLSVMESVSIDLE